MKHTADFLGALAGPWTDIQDQLGMLYTAACQYPRVVVGEFGVRNGQSTRAFLAAAERQGGHVHSWDLSTPDVPSWWQEHPYWTFTRQDSRLAAPPALDVLFVDTSHVYEATLHELRHLVPFVRPGGIVLMHDTRIGDPPGSSEVMVASDVAKALDDYCADTGRKWEERGGHYGLGQIVIPR
jgi:cephalosporin hydroxylase